MQATDIEVIRGNDPTLTFVCWKWQSGIKSHINLSGTTQAFYIKAADTDDDDTPQGVITVIDEPGGVLSVFLSHTDVDALGTPGDYVYHLDMIDGSSLVTTVAFGLFRVKAV